MYIDRKIFRFDVLDGIAVSSENKITEIEWLFNNGMALQSINNADPLRQNDDLCH